MPLIIIPPFNPIQDVETVFTDDFESYTIGGSIPDQNDDYTVDTMDGAATWRSQVAFVGGSKVLNNNITLASTRAAMLYTPWSFTDGRLRTSTVHTSAATRHTGPGLIARYTDSDHYIAAYLMNETNKLTIENRDTTETTTFVGFSPTDGVTYYFEMVVTGALVTATLYTDPGYSSVAATVSLVPTILGAGQAGLFTRGNVSITEFDNLEIIREV